MDNQKQIKMNFGPNYDKYNIIGKSEKINETIAIIKTVAPTNISVLITGESGTGKEVFANLIHRLSLRNKRNFIAINCGAIPEGLIENELFGHEKGSFTGASDMRKGYFESADKGTIFLDEIGELPLSSQVKLLRVLENGSFMRVGGTSDIIVDVRIIAATNRDLGKMVDDGSFREDLYYRLKAVNLEIPSLKQRLEDIPLFIYSLAPALSKKHDLPPIVFEKEAIAELINCNWKGNVRELKNFIDMVCVMEAGKTVSDVTIRKYIRNNSLTSSNLPIHVTSNSSEKSDANLIFKTLLEIKHDIFLIKEAIFKNDKNYKSGKYDLDPEKKIASIDSAENVFANNYYGISEKDEIELILNKHRGNRRMVAKELNISERTLYRKLEKYGLK